MNAGTPNTINAIKKPSTAPPSWPIESSTEIKNSSLDLQRIIIVSVVPYLAH